MFYLLIAILGCRGKDEGHKDGPGDELCEENPGEALCDGAIAVRCDDKGQVDKTEECSGGCSDGECVSCDLEVDLPYAAASPLVVEVDEEGGAVDERFMRYRPIDITGSAEISWDGPLRLAREDGTEIEAGDELEDERILVSASAEGEAEIVLTSPDGCAEEQLIELVAKRPAQLAVAALEGFPYADVSDVFTARDTVSVLVDGTVYSDRVGLTADAYLLRHRSPSEWAAERSLGDAVAGPVQITVGADPASSLAALWSDLPSDEILAEYDAVVDFGDDGLLDPGDLLDGLSSPALLVGGDLSAEGPYGTEQTEISASFWVTMRVYWPSALDSLDPVPLVVISHGNGHEYTWYDYLGEHLSSHGYAVISHRNNTGPGPLSAAETTIDNLDAFLGSLSLIEGGVLDGEIDTSAVALIGHSRGGEGVVIAYNWVHEGDVVPQNFSAQNITLVSSIAPTVFEDPRDDVNPHEVTYHLMAGSVDGDVTGGPDNYLVQYLRILQNARGLSLVTYLQGADHNDFNCCGFNDASFAGPHAFEIGRERAQQAAKSYYLALLEAHFRGKSPLWEYFTRAPERMRPDGSDVIIASQAIRSDEDRDFIIDDFQSNFDLALSSSGSNVTGTARALFEGPLDDGDGQLAWDGDPMNGMTGSEDDVDPERGLVLQWDEGDDDLYLDFELPQDLRSVRDFAYLSLRVAQGTRHPNTVALDGMLSFSVELRDGEGRSSSLDHRVYGGIPKPYERGGLGSGMGWVNEFQTIRIPISAFAAAGRELDLDNITSVRLLFGPSYGSPVGRIGIDDLELLTVGAP